MSSAGSGASNEVLRTALRKLVVSEHVEQCFLVQRLSLLEKRYPELELLYAVPNGGLRSKATAGKLKAEGVKPAVPDLVLPAARFPFHGLYLEMKRVGEYATPEQREFQRRLIAQDYAAVTCQGSENALVVVERYLRLPYWVRAKGALHPELCGISVGVGRIYPAGERSPVAPTTTTPEK